MKLKRYAIKTNNGVLLRLISHSIAILEKDIDYDWDENPYDIFEAKPEIRFALTDDKEYTQIWITPYKHLAENALKKIIKNVYDLEEQKQNTENTPFILTESPKKQFFSIRNENDLNIVELEIVV